MSCPDVIIVGGGLAGLCCVRVLQEQGLAALILESSDAVGGRIRTDIVDGFRLDRGFQVFLTAYPEPARWLDYNALNLKPFLPGALVRYRGKFHELTDPWRRPFSALKTLFSPIGSFADKLRIARLRSRSMKGTIEERMLDKDMTTYASLKQIGFTDCIIDQFFRPFLGGVFLDSELSTSRRMLDFVFRMFSTGVSCLPENGMEAIPKQLAAKISPDGIRFRTKAIEVTSQSVVLESGEELKSRAVVVATDQSSAANLLGEKSARSWQSVTCIYFAAKRPPVEKPMLVLNGDGAGPINNLCVPSVVSPTYSMNGESLISVTVLGIHADESHLLRDVCAQLQEWFAHPAGHWRHLRTYRITQGLPRQAPPALEPPQRPVRTAHGIYLCGDHMDNASINGAMFSGRRAAQAVLEDLS